MSMLIDEVSIYNTDIGIYEFPPLPNVKADDYYFLTILTQDDNEMVLVDSGWTQVTTNSTGGSCEVEIWYKKVVTDNELATAVENTGADNTWCNLALFRGFDLNDPIDAADGDYASSSASAICPSVTSSQDNQIMLRVAVSDGQNMTIPTTIPALLFETDYYMGWTTIDAESSGTFEIPLAAADQWAATTIILKRANGDTSTPLEVTNDSGGTDTITSITGQTHNGGDWRDIVRADNTTLDIKGVPKTWSIDMSKTVSADTVIVVCDGFSTVFPVGDGTSTVTYGSSGNTGTLKKIERYDGNSYYLYLENFTGNNITNNETITQSGTNYTCQAEGSILYNITTNMIYMGVSPFSFGRGCYITGMSNLGVSDGYYIFGTNKQGNVTDRGYTVLGYWVDLFEDATQLDLSTALTLTPPTTGTATITDTGMLIYDYETTAPFAYPYGVDSTGPYWNANVVGNNKVFTTAKDFSEDINVIFTKPYGGNTGKAWFWASDSSGNWKCWLLTNMPKTSDDITTFIDFADIKNLFNSGGNIDATDIKYYGTFFQQKMPTNYRTPPGTYDLYRLNTMTITGGSNDYPIELWQIAKNINKGFRVNGEVFDEYMSTSAPSQFLLAGRLKLGDGVKTNTTLSAKNTSISFNPHANGIGSFDYYVGAYKAGIEIDKCKGELMFDTIASDGGWFLKSTDDDIDLTGSIFVRSEATLLDADKEYSNITFVNSRQITGGGELKNCTVSGHTGTGGVLFDGTINGGFFNNNTYAIEINAAGDYTINDATFSSNTKDINVTATSGTVNITTNVSGLTYQTAGATVNILAPIAYTGLSFSGLITGTQVIIFETGTQTEITSVETSGTSFDWNPTYSADRTVDYTIYNEAYGYIRVVGLLCSDSIQNISIQQNIDRPYSASSGLTYTTDYSYNRVTKKIIITKKTSIQNFYCALKESFRNESYLRNTQFSIFPNGQSSFSFEDGISFHDNDDLANMHSDGFRFVNSDGSIRSIFCAITSQGNMTGMQAEYLSGDVLPVKKTYELGIIKQCFHIYQKDDFDYRNFLVIKAQVNGYETAFYNVVNTYGQLADEHYIITLEPKQLNMTLGDPSITGLSITDHGNSPVSWDCGNGAKNYSITITDTNNNSAEDIHRWINYNCSLNAIFEGKEPFYWHDMIIESSSGNYTTKRDELYGDVGATLKGVRVLRNTSIHPEFTTFQSDDGTYGVPPTVNATTISNIAEGSRVLIRNNTKTTEIYNGLVVGGTYNDTYTEGTDYDSGDSVTIRITQTDGITAKAEWSTTIIAGNGWSVLADQSDWLGYNTMAIDGSTITGFSADYVNDEVDLVVASNFTLADMFAWWCYNLTTEEGIRSFFGGLKLSEDGANGTFQDNIVVIRLDITVNSSVWATDNRRLLTSTGVRPVKTPTTSGYGIDIEWRNPVLSITTGGSALTSIEHDKLMLTAEETNATNNTRDIKYTIEDNS